ncbi:hypothetical protein C4587_00240 [Candidatus Parcubacteria bacterium]|nr:MAG: hypothetical protein C4587_00240 [Candidatus Parcubacteria bacterium]
MRNDFTRQVLLRVSAIAAIILFFGGLLFWLSDRLEARADDIAIERALEQRRVRAFELLAVLKRQSPEADSYRRTIESLVPPKDQLFDFPRWIEGLARTRNLEFDFGFQGEEIPPTDAALGYVGFALGAEGGFQDLVEFLKDVEERAPRFLVEIRSMTLEEGGGSYRFSGNGRVFFK